MKGSSELHFRLKFDPVVVATRQWLDTKQDEYAYSWAYFSRPWFNATATDFALRMPALQINTVRFWCSVSGSNPNLSLNRSGLRRSDSLMLETRRCHSRKFKFTRYVLGRWEWSIFYNLIWFPNIHNQYIVWFEIRDKFLACDKQGRRFTWKIS